MANAICFSDSSETDIVETLMSHSGQEVLDTQDYLTCSTYSTIRRSHLTIEKHVLF